jgi:hypothetical protein
MPEPFRGTVNVGAGAAGSGHYARLEGAARFSLFAGRFVGRAA